jgi:hypothetical protein
MQMEIEKGSGCEGWICRETKRYQVVRSQERMPVNLRLLGFCIDACVIDVVDVRKSHAI